MRKVMNDVKSLQKGDPLEKILLAGGKDVEALEHAASLGDIELLEGEIGKEVKTVGSEVKLSKQGFLNSCGSPHCMHMREKYAQALAKDENLEKRLLDLEKRAGEAAKQGEAGLRKRKK